MRLPSTPGQLAAALDAVSCSSTITDYWPGWSADVDHLRPFRPPLRGVGVFAPPHVVVAYLSGERDRLQSELHAVTRERDHLARTVELLRTAALGVAAITEPPSSAPTAPSLFDPLEEPR